MAGLTRLILIRHAQTDWNVRQRWQGQLDVPLNATGREQARALAERLSEQPIAAIYSSDLARALDTARPAARLHGLAVLSESGWRERHAGILHGLTGMEIRDLYPQAVTHNWFHSPPGGESNATLRDRVLTQFDRLLTRHPGETVAVVSHGGTLHTLLGHVLGLPASSPGRFTLRGNTGVSVIEVSESRGALVTLLNDTSHLDLQGPDQGPRAPRT